VYQIERGKSRPDSEWSRLASQLLPQKIKSVIIRCRILVIPELDGQINGLLSRHQVGIETSLEHLDVTDLAVTPAPFDTIRVVGHEVDDGTIGSIEDQPELMPCDGAPTNLTVEHSVFLSRSDSHRLHPEPRSCLDLLTSNLEEL